MGFDKLLIANRGEIACRIMDTAHRLGYATVAVYSEADAHAPHVAMADEAVLIGPAPVDQSYLNIEAILDACRRTGAQAVHPGYGFLSERAEFSRAVRDAGLVFVGPPPEAIDAMGDKARAKRMMLDADVPCIPGYEGEDQSSATFVAEAERIGLPLMVKAAAGGGGRGMRRVANMGDLERALESARSEAMSAFGSGDLLLERAIEGARHVEIQVFADTHGHVVHFGERDCSVQRRHQKVLEEAPSPFVDEDLRERMGRAAVNAARAVDYVGAGTVEFLVDAEKNFYFLEMNTRLQVEHRVTELVYGTDLVQLQLDIAQGARLGDAPAPRSSHAIQARLYAEDPSQNFLPQTGVVGAWEPPATQRSAAGEVEVHVDHGLVPGLEVTPFYDPMLAKVIAHGRDRAEAIRRLVRALRTMRLTGVRTNRDFLIECLQHEVFASGGATTAFLEEAELATMSPAEGLDEQARVLAALGARIIHDAGIPDSAGASRRAWASTGDVRWGTVLDVDGEAHDVAISGTHTTLGETTFEIVVLERDAHSVTARIDNVRRRVDVHRDARGRLTVSVPGRAVVVFDRSAEPPSKEGEGGDGTVRSTMSGRVLAVEVAPGDSVERGQLVAVVEAMKMEHELRAKVDGEVTRVGVVVGAQVSPGEVLVVIEAQEA